MTRPALGSEYSSGVVVLDELDKLINDRYRLLFAKIDLISRRDDKKVIAVTSAMKGEGKTTTATNLAVISARDFGKRVLLVDGDFKNPSVARSFNMGSSRGIVEVVSKTHPFDEIVKDGPVQGLSILTMGGLSGDKSHAQKCEEGHIWTGNGMKNILSDIRDRYDYVWIDAPPILPLFDMSVISETVDGILIVVRAGETSEAVLSRAVKVLGPDKVIGSVLNRIKKTWGSRYYGYGET